MGVPGNLRIFYTDRYRISGAARSKAPRTANKRGPQAEKEPAQKVIVTLIISLFAAILVFSALDWRFQWSPGAPWGSIAGGGPILFSFLFFFFGFRGKNYCAFTHQIAEDQKVISTGPYAIVRHPMYAGALVMLAGIPLALGSWWGLFFFFLTLSILTQLRGLAESKGYK